MDVWLASSSRKRSAEPRPRRKLLSEKFFHRTSLEVAPALLGKILVTSVRGQKTAGRIVEVEAYRGVLSEGGVDPAAHSARGCTPRSAPMFEDPGRAYVYFIYGMYPLLNFVTEPAGCPSAVLIRAVEPLEGIELMCKRRSFTLRRVRDIPQKVNPLAGMLVAKLASGPGRLAQAMGITMSWNRASLRGPKITVWDDGFRPCEILATPRVGIQKGRELPWRFIVRGSNAVTPVPENKRGISLEM